MLPTSKSLGLQVPVNTQEYVVAEKYNQQILSVAEDVRSKIDSISNRDEHIYKEAIRVGNAYLVDGLFKQAVDRQAEMYRSIELSGSDRVLNYLRKRLSELSLNTGEHWETLLSRVVAEQVKTGTSFLLKERDIRRYPNWRPLYTNRPSALRAIYIVPIEILSAERDERRNFVGWSVKNSPQDTTLGNVKREDKTRASLGLIRTTEPRTDKKNILLPGVDIVQICHKRPPGALYGVGNGLTSLEDLSAIRILEQVVAIMMKKDARAFIHHKITRPLHAFNSIQPEIDRAIQWHQTSPPGGVFVSGDNHEIEVKGSESRAIRAEGYLDYGVGRFLSGMGVSPFLLGLRQAGLGAVEGALRVLNMQAKFLYTEIAREFEFHVLYELLWEGGFDPYSNKDDQVSMRFVPIDMTEQIKEENHEIDAWTKGWSGLDEGRTKYNRPKSSDADHYLYRYAIPLEREKAKAKAIAAPPSPSVSANREQLLNLVPTSVDAIDDYLFLLRERFGWTPANSDEFIEQIEALLGDDLAIVELTLQSLGLTNV